MSRLPLRLLTLFVCVAASLQLPAAQTIGPWNLLPPDSASLISGGGVHWDWINVENVPLTLEQAMTSWPIDEQGYANADSGTEVQVNFVDGVTNNVGPDLVMLDANFDQGNYSISCEYDGYGAGVAANIPGMPIATENEYYYLNAGPYRAKVRGVEVDLSDLGVPSGTTVYGFRFECIDAACDPIGLVKIADTVFLDVVDVVAGSFATLTVSNATAGGQVMVGLSLVGNQPTLVGTGVCGHLVMELQYPIQLLAQGVADGTGEFSTTLQVPPGAAGRTVYLQALDVTSCEISNATALVVQ